MELRGTGVVMGVVSAPAVWVAPRPELPKAAPALPEDQREAEIARFLAAAEAVAARLESRAEQCTGHAAEVLLADAGMARDKGWVRAATKLMAAGEGAPQAAVGATAQFIEAFEKVGGLMAERITDLKDVRDRVLAELAGMPEPGLPVPTVPSVLMADDLAPADTAGLDPALYVALVTRLGGPTSHTAIISRQLGIPCIVGVSALHDIAEGTTVLVDGGTGLVETDVTEADAAERVRIDAVRREAIASWHGPAQLSDGTPVQLLANVADGAAARKAAQAAVEGVGLFRTELCFLSAQAEPSVEEQTAIYREVFDAFPDHKVVVRTLDAGSDKPLMFVTLPNEENPALGVRGVRIAAEDRGILLRQLDAIQAAQGAAEAWVMAPMVAQEEEAIQLAADIRERGMKAGIMVEVPAVAVLAERFIQHVDFMSIGTNDLTQYTMAADRLSPELATLTDAWQPAVLRLIQMTAEAGQKAGKPVGVCGEAAADPKLACVLVGMGVTSLSMAASAVQAVGAQLSMVDLPRCRAAAAAAVAASSANDAREAVGKILVAG